MKTPIHLPFKVYALLAGAAAAGAATLALTYPPDRLIGLMFQADEELSRAIAFFEAWNANHPSDYETRWHTVELLLETARPEDALAALEQMNATWPNDPRVVARTAEVYDGLLDIERSMLWTEKLSELRPSDAAIVQRLVSYHRWFGRTDRLIAALKRYVELVPSPDEHRELTDLLIANHRLDEVIAFNAKYAEKNPDAVEPHLALYRAYLHTDKPDLALLELKAVMRLEPEGEDADLGEEDRIDLADKLFDLRVQELVGSGDTRAAIQLYRARIDQNPTSVALRLRLAELSGEGADAAAAKELEALVELAPDSYAGWRALGYRRIWLGRTKSAADAFARAVALAPEKLGTRRALAEALSELGRTEDALAHWRWLSAHGGGARDGAELVEALVALGRSAEALPEAKALVRRAPGSKDYARLLAKTAMAAKKCGEVMAELNELVRRFAEDSESWSLYGLCAKQAGLDKEAVEALEKAARLHARGHEPGEVGDDEK
jgi:tetratricopeptide (TPR) repeat protein